jgi:sulfoxide reductase heme-binding subunit YedZ
VLALNATAMQRFLKPALFCIAALPAVHIAATVPRLVEPIEFIVVRSGNWTTYFLCIALAVTPLRRLLPWPALAGVRGMLGLFAFFYATVHVLAVVWLDQGFDLAEVWHHIVLRPTNTLDAIAYLMLLPLAVTSTKRVRLRLGAQRWQRLHRLAYCIAPLAAARFWAAALDGRGYVEAVALTLVLAALLGIRLYWHFCKKW